MHIFSVSELTHSIKTSLELQYRFVHIQGEVSNLRIPYSGHMYFTLKDGNAQIKAVLFKGQQKFLAVSIEEGQSLICHGRISVYEPRGEYQIIVDTVDVSGVGDLRLEFEILKKQLAEQGLFSVEKKKSIPPFPEHIVLITSPTGAAVRDFLNVAAQRKYWGKITVLPVAVQGKSSSQEISEALRKACTATNGDVVVVLRGGGALEDLWSFNEEITARAIHDATIPVVTGVGHDTDTTIADLCADLATHTPTAAAEAIIVDNEALQELFLRHILFLAGYMHKRLDVYEEKVSNLRRIMGNLDLYLAHHRLRLDYQTTALAGIMQKNIGILFAKTEKQLDRLHNQAPVHRILLQEKKLEYLYSGLTDMIQRQLERSENRFARQAALLDSVSPLSVLARGYAIVSTVDSMEIPKEIVTDSDQVHVGSHLNIQLHAGELYCNVVKKDK